MRDRRRLRCLSILEEVSGRMPGARHGSDRRVLVLREGCLKMRVVQGRLRAKSTLFDGWNRRKNRSWMEADADKLNCSVIRNIQEKYWYVRFPFIETDGNSWSGMYQTTLITAFWYNLIQCGGNIPPFCVMTFKPPNCGKSPQGVPLWIRCGPQREDFRVTITWVNTVLWLFLSLSCSGMNEFMKRFSKNERINTEFAHYPVSGIFITVASLLIHGEEEKDIYAENNWSGRIFSPYRMPFPFTCRSSFFLKTA